MGFLALPIELTTADYTLRDGVLSWSDHKTCDRSQFDNEHLTDGLTERTMALRAFSAVTAPGDGADVEAREPFEQVP